MSRTTSRAIFSYSTRALVVISPASTMKPVLVSVSHATRERGSWSFCKQKTAYEIWSHILSGWPIDTDSEVNSERPAMGLSPLAAEGRGSLRDPRGGLKLVGEAAPHFLAQLLADLGGGA